MADGQGRALVGNAADPEQVASAIRTVKRRLRRRFDIVRGLMALPEFREFVWGEFERHRIYDLVRGPSDEVFLFLGKREAGVELLVEVQQDHPELYLQMWKEALARQAQDARAVDAAHTRKAEGDVAT